MDDVGYYVLGVVVLIVLFPILYRVLRIIPPYAQGVVVILGSYRRTINPGLNLVQALAQVVVVDLRPRRAEIPISVFPLGTGAPVRLGGSAEYRVTNAAASVFTTRNLGSTMANLLRDSIATAAVATSQGDVLSEGWKIAGAARASLAETSSKYGVEIMRVGVTVVTAAGPVEYFDAATPTPVPKPPVGAPR